MSIMDHHNFNVHSCMENSISLKIRAKTGAETVILWYFTIRFRPQDKCVQQKNDFPIFHQDAQKNSLIEKDLLTTLNKYLKTHKLMKHITWWSFYKNLPTFFKEQKTPEFEKKLLFSSCMKSKICLLKASA